MAELWRKKGYLLEIRSTDEENRSYRLKKGVSDEEKRISRQAKALCASENRNRRLRKLFSMEIERFVSKQKGFPAQK